jgi:3-hydroxyacyl-[acyl-carrier-protein] dehydratase
MEMNKEEVMAFLPHRDPFLFVDSVETVLVPQRDVAPGKVLEKKELVGIEVLANYYTDPEHSIFKGHFPGNPILPGVVQVEMMAQASSFVVTKMVEDHKKVKIEVALLGVERAKFRKPITPDMHLQIKATCTKIRGGFVNFECELHHKGDLMSQSNVFASLKIIEKESE